MKNLRLLLATAMALTGTSAILAQTPPPGIPTDPPPVIAVQPAYMPRVAIEETVSSDWPKMWVNLGWAFYWVAPEHINSPLLTTSDPIDAGIPGNPTTTTLVGQRVEYGTFNGGTYSGGSWFDRERTVGMEGTTVWSEIKVNRDFFASEGDLPLYRPFIDAATLTPTSAQVAAPDFRPAVLCRNPAFSS